MAELNDEDRRKEHWELYKLVLEEQRDCNTYHRDIVTQSITLVAVIVAGTLTACGLLKDPAAISTAAGVGSVLVAIAAKLLSSAVARNYTRVLKTISTRAKLEADLSLDNKAWRILSEPKLWEDDPVIYPEDKRNRTEEKLKTAEDFVTKQAKAWDSKLLVGIQVAALIAAFVSVAFRWFFATATC